MHARRRRFQGHCTRTTSARTRSCRTPRLHVRCCYGIIAYPLVLWLLASNSPPPPGFVSLQTSQCCCCCRLLPLVNRPSSHTPHTNGLACIGVAYTTTATTVISVPSAQHDPPPPPPPSPPSPPLHSLRLSPGLPASLFSPEGAIEPTHGGRSSFGCPPPGSPTDNVAPLVPRTMHGGRTSYLVHIYVCTVPLLDR
jgi:hypothetical protein